MQRISYNHIYIFAAFVILCIGCSSNAKLQLALEEADANAPEIEKVLGHYDDERRKAAEYLVETMIGRYGKSGEGLDSIEMLYTLLPQKNGSWQFDSTQLALTKRYESMPVRKTIDLQTLSADYLIRNIDDAWNLKNEREWNKDLSITEFCELLLPYRSGDEEVTEWREAYRSALDSIAIPISNARNSVEAARIVAKTLGEIHYNNKVKTPHRPATGLLKAPAGYCREDCDRNLYAMRAFGIPVTIDEILVSPDNGTPHQWNVVYDNVDRTYRMFDNHKYLPTRDSIHRDGRRKGKIYRRTQCFNPKRLKKYENAENPPAELLNLRHKDATSEYFGHNEAKINVEENTKDVYLGLFTPDGYKPIDIAICKGNQAIFNDIEPQLIYFPITRDGNEYRTCGMPFMLKSNGEVHYFIPAENHHKISLIRKMPFWLHHTERMSSIIGCKIQTGSSPTGPWKDVDSISGMPSHSFYRIPVDMDNNNRYIRILPSPSRRSQIGEIIASADSLAMQRLPLSVITDNMTAGKKKLVDGDVLTWTNYKTGYRDLIFRIDSGERVNSLFVVPRNDDNYIMPGEKYELFCFTSDGWESLGSKVATDFHMEFDAPCNAVLWLRNLTKGKEEQIFIYNDKKQLFNANL